MTGRAALDLKVDLSEGHIQDHQEEQIDGLVTSLVPETKGGLLRVTVGTKAVEKN